MEDSSKGERILSKVTIEGMALSKKGISLPATGGKEEKKVCRFVGRKLRESPSLKTFFFFFNEVEGGLICFKGVGRALK